MTTTMTGRYCRVRALLLTVGLPGLWSAHALGAGGTLTIIPHADLKNTDPIWTTAYITRNHGYMIYDTLFSLDEKFQPQPQMVDTWNVSADGLKYTFTLASGLKWHDGAPVRAADCGASIKRWGTRDGMGQKLMDLTVSLEAGPAKSEAEWVTNGTHRWGALDAP